MIVTHPTARHAMNEAVRERFRRHCRPKPKLSMSEWAERYVVLPSSTTRQAGRVRLAVAPYLRTALDAISDPRTQRVTFIAPSQSAKTTFVIVVVLYYAHQEPSPQLVVQPTISMAEDFSKGRLTPTIEASPELQVVFGKPRARDTSNTILSKHYPSGRIDITGANSPAGLASRPERVVTFDECDRYPEEAGGEGDPISIGEARTRSYQRKRKIVIVTSPTDEPEQDADGRWWGSRGWREYLAGTREVWEEPCPHCGEYQVLTFDRLKWEPRPEGDGVIRESVCYPCLHCDQPITEEHRPLMRARARFRQTKEGASLEHRSFHVQGLSAAFALWDELATEFRKKKNDPVTLKTFLNTALGVVWKDVRMENVTDVLVARARRYDGRAADEELAYEAPLGVAVLTAGVDVQHDRLEVTVWGWGVGQQAWLITHEIFHGDPTQKTVWEQLDEWRKLRWRHESGATLKIGAMAVDAGDGNMMQHVINWCGPRLGEQVFAIKGASDPGANLVPRTPKRAKNGRLYVIGVNGLTERWHRRLNMPTDSFGPGYVHLNHRATEAFVKQLLGMERKYDPKSRRRKWVPRKNTRVEASDCANYALAALLIAYPREEQIPALLKRVLAEAEKSAQPAEPTAVPVPLPKKTKAAGSYLGRKPGKWL
jgi:phage terminase large subunit GpA-like protein